MKMIAIPAGPIETNAWLFINNEKGEALLFDAPPQSYHLIQKELKNNKCKLKALFLTHGHWDHMLDTYLFEKEGIPVYAAIDSKDLIEHPESMSDYAIPGLSWEGSKITHFVENNESLDLCGTDLLIMTTPGHCPGSIVIYIKELEHAVTGDLIIDSSIGRTDLPGRSFDQLRKEILSKVYTLPDNTVLCPGHGNRTTVKKEKKTNPFVREEI